MEFSDYQPLQGQASQAGRAEPKGGLARRRGIRDVVLRCPAMCPIAQRSGTDSNKSGGTGMIRLWTTYNLAYSLAGPGLASSTT